MRVRAHVRVPVRTCMCLCVCAFKFSTRVTGVGRMQASAAMESCAGGQVKVQEVKDFCRKNTSNNNRAVIGTSNLGVSTRGSSGF